MSSVTVSAIDRSRDDEKPIATEGPRSMVRMDARGRISLTKHTQARSGAYFDIEPQDDRGDVIILRRKV
jgi:hypothetical protein